MLRTSGLFGESAEPVLFLAPLEVDAVASVALLDKASMDRRMLELSAALACKPAGACSIETRGADIVITTTG